MNTSTKPANTASPQAFRDAAEKSTAQALDNLGKMSAAATRATDVMKSSYSTTVKGAQDYNNKLLECIHTNTNALFDFAHRLSTVKSPSEFAELTAEHARKQFEVLAEQGKELAALAQRTTLAAAEPLKSTVTDAISHAGRQN